MYCLFDLICVYLCEAGEASEVHPSIYSSLRDYMRRQCMHTPHLS